MQFRRGWFAFKFLESYRTELQYKHQDLPKSQFSLNTHWLGDAEEEKVFSLPCVRRRIDQGWRGSRDLAPVPPIDAGVLLHSVRLQWIGRGEKGPWKIEGPRNRPRAPRKKPQGPA